MRFSNPLSDREEALEDAFFRQENERPIASLRSKKAQSERRAARVSDRGKSDYLPRCERLFPFL